MNIYSINEKVKKQLFIVIKLINEKVKIAGKTAVLKHCWGLLCGPDLKGQSKLYGRRNNDNGKFAHNQVNSIINETRLFIQSELINFR